VRVSASVTRHLWLAVTLADQGIHLRQPTPFTSSRCAFAARLREGAARSRSPWNQRGLVRKPLRKISVILLHDVEQGFPG